MLAPSERAVLDVMFHTSGEARLEHRTPDHVYDLGAFAVEGNSTGAAAASFEALRVDPQLAAEHQSIDGDIERPPDKLLAFVASMPLLYGDDLAPATSYACPMHPEVTSSEPGTCPKCGMQLLPVHSEEETPTSYACPMHPEVTSSEPGLCPKCGMKLVPADTLPATGPKAKDAVHHEHQQHEQNDGLEWEDLMPEINRASEPSNMRWMLIDRESGAENGAITWAFRVGDRVKIRLVNEMESDHPCTTRSMSTAPGASWSCLVTGSRSPTWCGRTPCSCPWDGP
jgi:hypothetical protein